MDTDPTRMCELLVGLPVRILGVDDVHADAPIVVFVEHRVDR